MYLMNVPPVAATRTQWRTCGPPGGYSLQCFNDSDTELSTAGTPISDKVQMIIESLRSSQSSLEMSDEIEGNMLSGQEGHPQVCRVAVSSYVGAKSKTKVSTEKQQAAVSSPINHGSSDSDSDDSVDRGIEEAIREYLKEKDDHKRKAKPFSPLVHSSKIPRKDSPVPEVPKEASDSAAFLITSNQFLKSVQVEPIAAPTGVPIKKYIKNKASLEDDIAKKLDSPRSTTTRSVSKEPEKSPSKSFSQLNKLKCSMSVKVEEDSDNSSSDDGIEEAIQRYQMEKREQENSGEFKGDSDSTSDDGIEEAIRCYQLEQLKEKPGGLKPFFHKPKPFSKSLVHAVGTSKANLMKHKLKKKKARTENEVRHVPHSPVFMSTRSDNPKDKGNGLPLFKLDTFTEQHTPTPPKINTTAELMCAEAILDISKTVMPEAFHRDVGLGGCVPHSSTQPSPPLHCQDAESDDSSIDSEEGIEQEIRRFLEQKAQMHIQPPVSAVIPESKSGNEAENSKAKQVAAQKQRQRLSLSQRRKLREENGSVCRELDAKTTSKYLAEQKKDSGQVVFSHRTLTYPGAAVRKTEQSGDKSSSLDSDEDLDTAIRDLLKTKRKSKKKIRDLKQKSKKCLKEEPLVKTKKLKLDPMPRCSALKKTHKSNDDMKDKSGVNMRNISHRKQTEDKVHGDETQAAKEMEDQETVLLHNNQPGVHIKDDSSSVDSDDSIEQEIRRFLAEKAKVSTEEKSKDEDALRNGTVMVCTLHQDEGPKQENQLAEIPRERSITPLSGKAPHPQDWHPAAHKLADASTTGAQSPPSVIQCCSPVALEPADGAGAARTDQRRPSPGKRDVQQAEGVQPACSPSVAHSRSASIKWRQSLGLPITDTRLLGRTQFHITSSKTSETASANPLWQSRGLNLKSQAAASAWSSPRTGRSPFSCSTETAAVNTPFRSSVLNLATARRPRVAFAQSLPPGHSSQCPVGGERASTVHIPKDKSVFVELESNRTNHVQVRSRDRNEGKERADLSSEKKEVGSLKKNDKEVRLERTEEFVDEADCESGNRRNPETKQGFSTLSLSSAIDPGITFRPCIALTTAERSTMFNRRYQTQTCTKEETHLSHVSVQNQTLPKVKRKLQFRVSVFGRKTEAPIKDDTKE